MSAPASRREPNWVLLFLLLAYAGLAGAYFVLRYGGRWGDSDTANLTVNIASLIREGTLTPATGGYKTGFAYPALAAFITSVTGLSAAQLQFLVFPLVAAGLSLVAFAMYRALAGDTVVGAVAALLLFMQPDFLFAIFRGSHEKVTWLATMLAVLLLARSFEAVGRLSRLAACVALFYMAVYALVASNAFFGSSFILASAVSLTAGVVLVTIGQRRGAGLWSRLAVQRLALVVVSALALWYLQVFHLYPPTVSMLYDLHSLLHRTTAVALGHQPGADPYAVLAQGWVSPAAYVALMLPSYVVGGASLVAWAVSGMRMLVVREWPRRVGGFLLWLLYAGFGLQLAAGFFVARAGGMAYNMQHRFFPVMTLLGSGITATLLVRLWQGNGKVTYRRLLAVGLTVAILWSSAASLLKCTNDLALSNYWGFWTQPEDQALRWVEGHVQYGSVWLDLQGIRVSAHAVADGFGSESQNERDNWVLDVETRDILLSRFEVELGARISAPLPDTRNEHRVYDNGTVAHYHRRPRTPYQH